MSCYGNLINEGFLKNVIQSLYNKALLNTAKKYIAKKEFELAKIELEQIKTNDKKLLEEKNRLLKICNNAISKNSTSKNTNTNYIPKINLSNIKEYTENINGKKVLFRIGENTTEEDESLFKEAISEVINNNLDKVIKNTMKEIEKEEKDIRVNSFKCNFRNFSYQLGWRNDDYYLVAALIRHPFIEVDFIITFEQDSDEGFRYGDAEDEELDDGWYRISYSGAMYQELYLGKSNSLHKIMEYDIYVN